MIWLICCFMKWRGRGRGKTERGREVRGKRGRWEERGRQGGWRDR